MFHSKESNGIFRLQNNTVTRLPSIQFNTTFKQNYGIKVNIFTCVSAKLQMNHKRSLNKALTKYFWKISSKDFGN